MVLNPSEHGYPGDLPIARAPDFNARGNGEFLFTPVDEVVDLYGVRLTEKTPSSGKSKKGDGKSDGKGEGKGKGKDDGNGDAGEGGSGAPSTDNSGAPQEGPSGSGGDQHEDQEMRDVQPEPEPRMDEDVPMTDADVGEVPLVPTQPSSPRDVVGTGSKCLL